MLTYSRQFFGIVYLTISFAQTCFAQNCTSPETICGWGVGYTDWISCAGGCNFGYYQSGGECCCQYTPIIIDLSGEGIHLSSAENGVLFRITGRQDSLKRIAWPERGSENAWLVLDRNGNGLVDDSRELFGNTTPLPVGYSLPPGIPKNGFTVLAAFDRVEYGGNQNGLIDSHDSVYRRLRLWIDRNRNGISEASELITLEEAGIVSIDLDYRNSHKIDTHGNEFRWRSKIQKSNGSDVAPWAWDVKLKLTAPPPGMVGLQSNLVR